MWKAIFTPHTNVPSTASATGCPAVAGFLCDKVCLTVAMLMDTILTPLYMKQDYRTTTVN